MVSLSLAANEAMHRIVVDHGARPVRDHLTLYVRTGLVVIRNQRQLIRLLYPDVDALATLYVGSVVNVGVLEALLGEPSPVDDDRFVAAFVDTLHTYLTTGGPTP